MCDNKLKSVKFKDFLIYTIEQNLLKELKWTFVTLYIGVQIASMKPTCIFGSSSFFFLSIIAFNSKLFMEKSNEINDIDYQVLWNSSMV